MVLDKQKSAQKGAHDGGQVRLSATHQQLYDTYLSNFMECMVGYSEYTPGMAPEIFRCKTEKTSFVMIEQLIDQVVIELYFEHVYDMPQSELLELVDVVHKCIKKNNDRQARDSILKYERVFLSLPEHSEIKKLTKNNSPALYSVVAIMVLNEIIPMIQKHGMGSVKLGYLMYLQQACDLAKSVSILDRLIRSVSLHVSPTTLAMIMKAVREQDAKDKAKRGGVTKAEKSYGEAKSYVRQRTRAIQQQYPDKKASKIAEMLYQELREKCGAEINAECPAYDTLYGWVRKSLQNKVF